MPKADVEVGDTVRVGSEDTIQLQYRDAMGVVATVKFGRSHHTTNGGPPWCNCRGVEDKCQNPWIQINTENPDDPENWPSGDWLNPRTGKPQWVTLRPPPKFASTEDAERWLNTQG